MDLNILSHVSDDACGFALEGTGGDCLCIVSAEGEVSEGALKWLRQTLAERFERTIIKGRASDHKAAVVGFIQSAHRRLYAEMQHRTGKLGQISMAVIVVREGAAILATIGNSAAYRIKPGGTERLLPTEGSDEEPSFLGQELKVQVEMNRQPSCVGYSYLLTSHRLDKGTLWAERLREALARGSADAGTAVAHALAEASGVVGVLQARQDTSKLPRHEDLWCKELREELVRAGGGREETARVVAAERSGGERGGKGGLWLRRMRFVIVLVAVAVVFYALWTHWAGPRLQEGARREYGGSGEGTGEIGEHGVLTVSSIPLGAQVILDGHVVRSESPASLVSATPGRHQVTVKHGSFGEWARDVVLDAGDTTSVDVRFVGDIAVSSGRREGLSVLLDGEVKGTTPCLLEDVAAGRHVVTIVGEEFGPWEEEVVVAHEAVAEVHVVPVTVSKTATVRVTSTNMTPRGYEDSSGEGVYVDGHRRGSTPVDIELKPGLHSIRVSRADGSPGSVRLLQAKPGARHFVQAEFGGVEPLIVECEEIRTKSNGGPLIQARLSGREDLEIADVTLCLRREGTVESMWQPMLLVPGSRRVYAAAVPNELAGDQGQLKYFARVTTSGGLEYFSELKTLYR